MANDAGKSVAALLAGAAVGAGIGILFAPDKGSNTRQKIKNGIDDAKVDLENKLGEAKGMIKDKLMQKKYDLEDSYDQLVSNVADKKQDLVGFLENKLSELKKAQHPGMSGGGFKPTT